MIQYLVSDYLYASFLELDQGELSLFRSKLVSSYFLSDRARELGLADMLLLGESEKKRNIHHNDAVLENAWECFVGALYLTVGLNRLRLWYISCLQRKIGNGYSAFLTKSYKSHLQELLHKKGLVAYYQLKKDHGDWHENRYEVEVYAEGRVIGKGVGRSIKEAEKKGACEGLSTLKSGFFAGW